MYDFLDKIGLKAVLEAIKGKIPTTLPANGGNADTVGHRPIDEIFFSVNLNGISDVDNTDGNWSLSAVISATAEISGTFPPNCPDWVVINQYQTSISKDFIIQTCQSVNYNTEATPRMWIRNKYVTNEIWSDWKEISTTPIKKTTFPSVATNAGGRGTLFSSDFGTPIVIACTSRADTQCTPFFASNQWLVLAKDAVTLDPIVGSYSFNVWYI